MDLSNHKHFPHILEYLETAIVGRFLSDEGPCEIPYIDPGMPASHLIKLHLALRKHWEQIPETYDPAWNNVGISSYARASGVQLGRLYSVDLNKISRTPCPVLCHSLLTAVRSALADNLRTSENSEWLASLAPLWGRITDLILRTANRRRVGPEDIRDRVRRRLGEKFLKWTVQNDSALVPNHRRALRAIRRAVFRRFRISLTVWAERKAVYNKDESLPVGTFLEEVIDDIGKEEVLEDCYDALLSEAQSVDLGIQRNMVHLSILPWVKWGAHVELTSAVDAEYQRYVKEHGPVTALMRGREYLKRALKALGYEKEDKTANAIRLDLVKGSGDSYVACLETLGSRILARLEWGLEDGGYSTIENY